MHEVYLNSVKDTLLVGVPFVAVLALGIFRLDTLIFSSKPTSRSARQGCGLSADGEPSSSIPTAASHAAESAKIRIDESAKSRNEPINRPGFAKDPFFATKR